MRFDAFHLPGLEARDATGWSEWSPAPGLELRWPRLTAAGLGRLARRLEAARARALAARPVAAVVAAVDAAAAGLAESAADEEVEALLAAVTGYSPAMVRLVVERMLTDWRRAALESLLELELGDPTVLDGFRRDPAGAPRRVRALAPALIFNVFAGNVPGVAVTAMVRSLLVKSSVLGKTAADEPVLPVLFARALAEVDPALGECVAVTYWPGAEDAVETEAGGAGSLLAAACRAAGLCVVYGGEAAVSAVAARLEPGAPLVVHGPRASLGLVGREALAEDRLPHTVDRAARAVATFDQLGCVSPHVLYVEQGGAVAPGVFAERLLASLDALEADLPSGRLRPEEAARLRQVKGAAEMRELAGGGVRVLAGSGSACVIYDPDPGFTASCLHRTVWVKPLAALEDAAALVAPFAPMVQSAAVACDAARLGDVAERLARAGVVRITTLQALPWPPPHAHHDGGGPLRELLHWVDLEG